MSKRNNPENPIMIDTNPTSSEESVSTVRTSRKKRPFLPFYLLSNFEEVRLPVERYGVDNRTHFTMTVSHAGFLEDRPGEPYRRSNVNHLEGVNVDRLDLNELYLISRYLGYPTMGKWYYFNEDPNSSMELLPLRTEKDMASFRQVIRQHQCRAVEKVYVEHEEVADLYKLIPRDIMDYRKNRLKKLVYILLISKPEASVEEGIQRVKSFTGLEVSRQQMLMTMHEAREHLGAW